MKTGSFFFSVVDWNLEERNTGISGVKERRRRPSASPAAPMIASEPVNHHRRKAAGALVGVGVLLCGAVALSGRQHSASIIRVPDEKFELFGYEISFSMLPDLYAGFTRALPVTLGNLIHSKQEEIAAARGIFDKNDEYNGGSLGDGSWVDAMKECQKARARSRADR